MSSFLKAAREQGCEDAKKAFGVLNKTDKPPPTWAHGRKVKIPSMTQTDVSPKKLKE